MAAIGPDMPGYEKCRNRMSEVFCVLLECVEFCRMNDVMGRVLRQGSKRGGDLTGWDGKWEKRQGRKMAGGGVDLTDGRWQLAAQKWLPSFLGALFRDWNRNCGLEEMKRLRYNLTEMLGRERVL